jgi:NAD(P)-dependent dehydrogenase (short-subunit alcohol dehydrogenase family)
MKGKVGIITGGGSGIGRALALAAVESGACVMLAGRDESKLRATIAPYAKTKMAYHVTDVTKEDEVINLIDKTLAHFGKLDFAFNNAGTFGTFSPLHEDTSANFQHVVETNLKGIWLCMKYQIPHFLKNRKGSIVNCSSVAGLRGHIGSPIYSATKHALIGLSKSAAQQYGSYGLRINVVAPGSTDTEMFRSIYQSDTELQKRINRIPLGRLARPEEVASAALWLCGDGSSFVNGAVLSVDGGVTT